MTTVAIPRRSSSAATRLTVWLQIGQTGTSKAASTPSTSNNRAASGTTSR
jgi:hypothetical protein